VQDSIAVRLIKGKLDEDELDDISARARQGDYEAVTQLLGIAWATFGYFQTSKGATDLTGVWQ